MRKNFTFLFLMGIFGLFSTNLFAQQDASIDPANIRYWIGEGENEVVFAVNWNEPDTALAWGYRFNEETVTVEAVMNAIAEADLRFGYSGANGWLSDITFNDGNLDLKLAGYYWMYLVNGEMAMNLYSDQTVVDGDYIKWGDESCGTLLDPENYVYVWEKEVTAVYPYAQEAIINPEEILYWVGEGNRELIFAVNWNNPNICLAWGYRFNDAIIVVKDVMDAIAAADSRFAYDASAGFVSNITFDEGELHLALSGMYFLYNVDGFAAPLGYEEMPVDAGSFIKWGDESCATEIAQWTYVWTQTVEPVSVYTNVNENNATSLSVYPNPASGETFVTIENEGMNEISVYDMQGRLVSKQVADAMVGEQVRIDTEKMKAGVYFISVSNENAVGTSKLVVK